MPSDPAKRERRGERRLVPDLDDSVVVRGETLTRVKRVPVDEAAPEETPEPPLVATEDMMDLIAKKHLGANLKDLVSSLEGEPAPESDSPAALAGRLELFTDRGELPTAETNPDKRVGAVSPLILTDDAPDSLASFTKPETLLDLFSMFPQLDGANWFIHVNRKTPKLFGGIKCDGRQRDITAPISLTEWQAIYGGGTYELIVYGPPKYGGTAMAANGRVAPRRMTEPLTVSFPLSPILESAYSEDPMTQGMPSMLPRNMTMADASVEKTKVEIADGREKRAEDRERVERDKNEKLQREKTAADTALLTKVMEIQERAAARESELHAAQIEREREFAKEKQELLAEVDKRIAALTQAAQKPDDVERFVKISDSLNKGKGGDTEEHAREISRLTDQRAKDSENFTRQLKDERERADRICADERARADQRIKDAEERFHNKERDERERSASEIQKAKDECERRLAEQHRQHTDRIVALESQIAARIADLDRNHARDLSSKESAHAMQLETLKSTHEMRLDAAKGDVKRAGADIERYKKEAEEGRDVVGRIAKLKEEAAALGMVEASEAGGESEPETMPQMLMKIGANLAGALPGIVEQVGNMVKGKSDAELQAAQLRQRQQMLEASGQNPALQPIATHSRRGAPPRLAPLQPIAQVSATPLIPGHEPNRHAPPPNTIRPIPTLADQQPEEVMRQEFLARQREEQLAAEFFARAPAHQEPVVPGSGMDPMHTGMPPEPQMAPAPLPLPVPTSPSFAPPAASEASSAQVEEDREIVSTESFLLPSYTNQIPPEALAQEFLKSFPKEQIRKLLADLGSADRISEAYERVRGSAHPFARRDGKKFLRAVYASLEALSR